MRHYTPCQYTRERGRVKIKMFGQMWRLPNQHGALNVRSLDKSGWKSIMMETIILIASLGGEYSSTRKIALLKQLRENFYIDCPLDLVSLYFPSDWYMASNLRHCVNNLREHNRPTSTSDEQITHAVNVTIRIFAGKSLMLIGLAIFRCSLLRDFVAESITRLN